MSAIATLGSSVVSAARCGANTNPSADARRVIVEAVMTSRQKWGCVWGGWVTYFAVAEWMALREGDMDAPLSAHMRLVLGTNRPHPYRALGQTAMCAGIVWLADHLYRGAMNI